MMISGEVMLIAALVFSIFMGYGLNAFFLNQPIKFLLKKANKSAIRWNSQSKPIFGGITFYSIFIIGFLAYILLIDQTVALDSRYIALFIVVTLAFLMGLADDIINTPPVFKFVIQMLIAVILISFDIFISISPHPLLNYAITIFWVVGIMNSINMLDNMDSVANLVSISVFAGAFVLMVADKGMNGFMPFMILFALGACLSFLMFNWHPSKMYMGDNGSQFLGSMLAYIGIVSFWNSIPQEIVSYGLNSKQVIVVLLAFIVPITDTATVSINRILRGQSPFIGGRDHTTHYLAYAGLSDRKVAVLLFLINLISVAMACYIIFAISNWSSMWFWLFFAWFLIIFVGLYMLTKIVKQK
ncbi:MAG: MraY family glycosyltransferase [Bacteroidota bacterium]|nr:MraY family glycosyltransferase [Bacteroidota bacterium]